ncbi:MAG: hypothetical protein SH856_00315 [Flavobacteriales bacterium]|nr:hypothetical protein [Flavobacteriales bacterium]
MNSFQNFITHKNTNTRLRHPAFHYIVALFMVFMGAETFSQITIYGTARDENDQAIPNTYIINKRSEAGSFGNPNGTFAATCLKNDTVMIGALGFMPRYVCMKDSLDKPAYTFTIYLDRKYEQLAAVQVFAPRDLDQIREDIEKLGYNKNDFMLSGINAAESPITFLYQQFSRTERSKRLVAEMENADRKRELLKELFRIYVDWEIIALNDSDFDAFIDYINISDEYMKSASQYDFLVYVKERFSDYKIWKRGQHLDDGDYNYDKD